MTDPRDFTSIVQGPAAGRTGDGCVGTDAALGLPCRIEILCSSLRRGVRLADALRNALGATSACDGPRGLDRWATRGSETRNFAVAACARVPASSLEQAVLAHQGAGFDLVGVVPLRDESVAVPPASMANGGALRFLQDIVARAGEVVELTLDYDFRRRAIVSYAYVDRFSTADVLSAELGRRRFDTNLDRSCTRNCRSFDG